MEEGGAAAGRGSAATVRSWWSGGSGGAAAAGAERAKEVFVRRFEGWERRFGAYAAQASRRYRSTTLYFLPLSHFFPPSCRFFRRSTSPAQKLPQAFPRAGTAATRDREWRECRGGLGEGFGG